MDVSGIGYIYIYPQITVWVPEGIPIPKPVVDGEFNALEHQDIGSYKHVNLLPFLIHIGGG